MRYGRFVPWAAVGVIAVLGASCIEGDDPSNDVDIAPGPTDPSEPVATPLPGPEATSTATTDPDVTASPTGGETPDDLGTFVFDGTTDYAVIHACTSGTSEERTTYEALMVERGGGRAAFEFIVVDDDPDAADELYFELYGPGDAGAQFTGTASHELRGDVSAGAGEFDQGGSFAYEVDLSTAPPC
ncbi:MAG: hypothetical protein KY469_01810 [Actinobacteria bacterium]|nr:hypothetical protein [Actinomycetota bacterium]